MTQAYPLAWPDGWPRTPVEKRERPYRFGKTDYSDGYKRVLPTFAKSRDRLYDELRKLGAKNVILSTNHPSTDKYGIVIESKRRVEDDGIAVYFTMNGQALVMACDRFDDAGGNMTSLSLAIEAMRQLERHGGGTMLERAFTGFVALPAPKAPHEVLGVPPNASPDDIRAAYKRLALKTHPDAGGSTDAFHAVQQAYEAMTGRAA